MVRRCVVPNCNESDLTILAHRFPKSDKIALTWRCQLNLDIALENLKNNFVVCTKHFSSKSYRNYISNSLNSTAVPNLNENLDNERIQTTRNKQKENLPQISKIETPLHKKLKLIEEEQTCNDKIEEEDEQQQQQHYDYEFFNSGIESIHHQYEHQSTMTESVGINHVETQTDEEEKESIDRSDNCKDDKLIKLLYPEFSDMDKIQLIKLIIEKNEKIDSMKEKHQKLENAMRNLL